MGMHTPVDIGGGALIGLMVLSSYLSIDGKLHMSMCFCSAPKKLSYYLCGVKASLTA